LLESFSLSTGLRINYAKSCLVPINVSTEKATHLAGLFGCRIESLPFTYIGLPLGTTKPRIEHYGQIMSSIERKLSSVSFMLFQAGRLQLVNSVISSLPTYMMCTLEVPAAVLNYIDRARRHCLWRNSDCNDKTKSLVTWNKCTKPKKKEVWVSLTLEAKTHISELNTGTNFSTTKLFLGLGWSGTLITRMGSSPNRQIL
jgi:hypothetical protein